MDHDIKSENVSSKSSPRTSRRGDQISSVQIMFAVLLAVGLILAINFSSRIAAGQPLLAAYDEIQAEILQLEQEQATLIAERDYAQSDAYVEQWARDRGKMVRQGEKLVIPVPSGQTALLNAAPTPIVAVEFESGARELEPWELWWALFFDDAPPQINRPN